MSSDIDPDVFLSQVYQLRDEFGDLGEIVSNERLNTAILDALPEEMYSTVKMQSTRDLDLEIEEIISMTNTIFINHSERSSVPKKSQESYRKSCDISGREPTMSGRESAMVTIIIIHNCKRSGHKRKDCNQLIKIRIRQVTWRTAQGSGVHTINLTATRTRTAISSSRSQQIAMMIIDGARITKAEASQIISAITKRNGSRGSPADSKSRKDKTFVADSNVTGCDSTFSCKCKRKNGYDESKDESNSPSPGRGFTFVMCHPPLSQEPDGFQFLVYSGSFQHFIDPELVRGIESRMFEYTRIEPPRAVSDNVLRGTAQSI